MKEAMIVFRHEFRYFLTLKNMKTSILIQCFAPAIFVLLGASINQNIDLRVAVIIMIIGIPRIPMSLAGYSISGEKVYKTFESLLSTPVAIKSLFLGKLILPTCISFFMFLSSTIIVLISEFIYTNIIDVGLSIVYFSIEELIIIFANGLFIVTFIIFITAVATMLMKVPRNGLFITSVLTFLFGIPYFMILYVLDDKIMYSILSFIILLITNFICYLYLIKKVNIHNLFSRTF